jgi:hypothetical protein
MTWQPRALGALVAATVGLTGCGTAEGVGSDPPASEPSDGPYWSHGCVWDSVPGQALLDEVVTVSRGPEGPCEGLELGSTQWFELTSGHADDAAKARAKVVVAEDGSFSFQLRVPSDLRLGSAFVRAVPNDPACDDADNIDCPPAGLRITVGHSPAELTDVTLVSSRLEAPPLPTGSLGVTDYYLPGPEAGQVTLVIIGGGRGCEAVPGWYVTTAAPGSLEIVADRADGGCDSVATPYTSVIEVPEEYAAFESVKIDNVPAVMLAAQR